MTATLEAPAYEKTLPGGRGSLEPWIKDEVQFYPHQIEGIRTLARWKSFILGDDMGLGKSLQSLVVFAIDVYRGWSEKAIVVCPVALKSNWQDEIEKFSGFGCVVLDGSPVQRTKQLVEFGTMTGPRILVVNYEQVTSHLDQLNKFDFDVAIFDECHMMKNPKSQRTKACIDLRARRNFMLSGTPMLNQVNELWTLLHKISPDEFPRYWTFVNRYCVFGGFKDKQIVGVKNEAELTERLQRVMLRRLKKDVLGLPDVQYITRRVDMLPAQKKLYNEVIENLKLPRADTEDPDEIENALTKFLRLKQICGTTLPFTGDDISGKLDLAIADDVELLENGHKIVVFTQFKDVQSAYVSRLRKEKLNGSKATFDRVWMLNGDMKQQERKEALAAWKAEPGAAVICCMLQVAGVGLNMTEAQHASFLDELFVPGLNQQAVDRLHRIGQSETQPVQVRKYLVRDSVESRVQTILKTKSKLFGEIVNTDPDWKRKVASALIEAKVA